MNASGALAVVPAPETTASNAERRHALQQEFYRRLAEDPSIFDFVQRASSTAIWLWSVAEPDVEWLSPSFWTRLGYPRPPQDFAVATREALLHVDDRLVAQRKFRACLVAKQVPFDDIQRYAHCDGSTVWLRCQGRTICDETGKPVRVFGVYTDVSRLNLAQQTADEQRQELQASAVAAEGLRHRLERSNAELTQFAYTASHDLKAPLRAVRNLATWVMEDSAEQLNEDSRKNLHQLCERVERMDSLLDDLLDYSRIGREGSGPEMLDLNRMLEDVILLLPDTRGISIEVQPKLPRVCCVRMALQGVLVNLLSNAIKHHDRDEGVVRVAASLSAGEPANAEGVLEMTVTDDGPGIEPEFHRRIFELFQRLQVPAAASGNGMGLAMVKKAVAMQGGTIGVESVAGERGTTFRFSWPSGPSPDSAASQRGGRAEREDQE